MCSWRSFAVARVFALVLRVGLYCSLHYFRVAKTVTPSVSAPRQPGLAVPPLLIFLFSQKVLAVRKANDIYRPVITSLFSNYFRVYVLYY